MRTLTRRQVLAAALVVGAALLPGGVRLARQSAGHPRPPGPAALGRQLAARLSDLGADVGQLRAIGSRYLEDDPGAEVGDLLAGVAPSGVLPADLVALDGEGLRTALRRRATEDFRAGRFVNVGGWLLGAGEARLCAVVALVTPG